MNNNLTQLSPQGLPSSQQPMPLQQLQSLLSAQQPHTSLQQFQQPPVTYDGTPNIPYKLSNTVTTSYEDYVELDQELKDILNDTDKRSPSPLFNNLNGIIFHTWKIPRVFKININKYRHQKILEEKDKQYENTPHTKRKGTLNDAPIGKPQNSADAYDILLNARGSHTGHLTRRHTIQTALMSKHPNADELVKDNISNTADVIGPRPKSRNCQGHIIPWNGCSPFAWLRWVRLSVSNHYLDWPKEWGAGPFKRAGLHFPPHLWAKQDQWRAKIYHLALFRSVGLWLFSFRKRFCRSLIMGGESITTEPTVLKIDEDVRTILEEAGLLSFFKKTLRHGESITNQFVDSWKDGRVVVSGMEFVVSEVLIAEVSGLPNEAGFTDSKRIPAKPWDKVAVQVMKYLTLEGKFRKLFGYHIAILNSMKNKEKINIPLFLFKSTEKSVHAVKAGKGKAPLHQGLMKMIVDFEINRKSYIAGPSKGGFVRVSEAPISKAQLLLGPALSSPLLVSGDTAMDSEGDSGSPERNCPATNPKEKGSKKRKPPAQSSEEDRKSDDPESLGGRSSPSKVTVATPSEKSAKSSEGSHSLSEELRCHLRVLNGLGGSLTSTYACINLLTLEITNYLKERSSPFPHCGGGVQGCPNITPEIRDALISGIETSQSKSVKDIAKKQRVERDIVGSYSSIASTSNSAMHTASSSTLKSLWKPIEKQHVDDAMGDFFFANGIPFNVARSPYFCNMMQQVVEFGKGYKPPSSEALRTTILQRSKEILTDKLQSIEETWKHTGWKMMHSPLHAVACYLDPRMFGLKRNGDKEIMSGMYAVIETKDDRAWVALGLWWDFYGAEAPNCNALLFEG
eukprot:Gb_32267 [translate_table: standard]